MAYMSTDHAREIRNNLKKTFPKFKFAVRKDGHLGIAVSIMKGPVKFGVKEHWDHYSGVWKETDYSADHLDINHYHLHHYTNAGVLRAIYKVINKGNHDNSDIMTDYFDVGFYVHMEMGKWNKPFELVK